MASASPCIRRSMSSSLNTGLVIDRSTGLMDELTACVCALKACPGGLPVLVAAGHSFVSRRHLVAWLLAAAGEALSACAWTPVSPYKGTNTAAEVVYVAALGWHTEIGLRAEAIAG